MARPDKTLFTDAAVTEAQFKSAHDQLIDWLDALLGAVDDYIKVASGTDLSRPSATGSGWIRYNTDNNTFDVTILSAWKKLIVSGIDGTWNYLIQSTSQSILKLSTTNTLGKFDVGCASAGDASFGVDADEIFVKSTGTKQFRIWINGVPVFKIDSSGNVTATGDITANGSV